MHTFKMMTGIIVVTILLLVVVVGPVGASQVATRVEEAQSVDVTLPVLLALAGGAILIATAAWLNAVAARP